MKVLRVKPITDPAKRAEVIANAKMVIQKTQARHNRLGEEAKSMNNSSSYHIDPEVADGSDKGHAVIKLLQKIASKGKLKSIGHEDSVQDSI